MERGDKRKKHNFEEEGDYKLDDYLFNIVRESQMRQKVF